MVHPLRSYPQARSSRARSLPRCRWVAPFALALGLASVSVEAVGQEAMPSAPARDVSKANQDLARSVAITGREAFNAGDYETAMTLFRRAYALFPAPTVVLYEARSLEKMGRLLEAVEAYTRTTQIAVDAAAPAQFAEAIAAAREEGRDLRANIPTLTLQVEGASSHDPNLEIQINGRAIGAAQIGQALSLDPGTYRVSGSVSPERSDERQAVLAKGNSVTVVLNLAAPAPKAPAPDESDPGPDTVSTSQRTLSPLVYVAGAVGIAGIGTGVVTGLMASSKHAEAEEQCQDQCCTSGTSGPATVNEFRTLRAVSTVSYGIGAAGIVAGVVLWLTADTSPESEQASVVEPWFTQDTAGIRGTF